ncbi:hypothetical protein OEZ77_27100, partial [Leclercia adecarboxylata]|uniref:hypothetical protein n=1 Tax=Leclercia adecarboxylata TaxID=83655 RepID=UPI00234C7A72
RNGGGLSPTGKVPAAAREIVVRLNPQSIVQGSRFDASPPAAFGIGSQRGGRREDQGRHQWLE